MGAFPAIFASLQASVVMLSQSEQPDALAASIAAVAGLGVASPAGLLGWWLENEVVKSVRMVISPDGHAWWDGSKWRAVAT